MVAGVAISTSLLGCGESEGYIVKGALPTVKVTGVVLVDGETPTVPKMVQIKFIADGEIEGLTEGVSPSAVVGSGGQFSAGTYDSGDGLPKGSYKLTFDYGQVNLFNGQFQGGLFKGKYDDPESSEFSVTITGSETEPIDLGTIALTTE